MNPSTNLLGDLTRRRLVATTAMAGTLAVLPRPMWAATLGADEARQIAIDAQQRRAA
jgi:hypothetical protein